MNIRNTKRNSRAEIVRNKPVGVFFPFKYSSANQRRKKIFQKEKVKLRNDLSIYKKDLDFIN